MKALRWIGVSLGILGLATTTLSCEQFYEGEIQGFVRDTVTKEGLNRATVRVFYEPAEGEAEEFQQTLTQTNQDAGYFVFRRIVWSTTDPLFRDEGDIQDVRILVEQEDYQSFETTIPMVSGASNTLGDIYLERAFFESGIVEGRILDREEDEDGDLVGINGLNVNLYIPDVLIETEAEAQAWVDIHTADRVATTQTFENDPGYYSFENVRWKIPGVLPVGGEDERDTPFNVIMLIEDPNHFDEFEPMVTIYSGEVGTELDDILVDKKNYQGNLEGYVIDASTDDGLNGITVDIYVPDEPIENEAALLAYVEDHSPDASGITTTDDDDDDGYFFIQNITWERDTPPDPTLAHQRQEVIVVADNNAYREEIIFEDTTGSGFEPVVTLISNNDVNMGTIYLSRTDFTADIEAYVRRTPGDSDSGENGVQLFLYYDEEDPDLSEFDFDTFDPLDQDWSDRTTTGNTTIADIAYEGYFRINNLGWENEEGGSLGRGRDEMTFILFSRGVDFSAFEGNTDPRWQLFTVVSKVEDEDEDFDEVNTLPDLRFRPTEFEADIEGYIRRILSDPLSGVSGLEVKVFFDENDPDLSELDLEAFIPEEVDFNNQVNTRPDDEGNGGYFFFNNLFWRNLDGPSVGNDRDRLTLILYCEDGDFTSFDNNLDPHWQVFTVVSDDGEGEDVNAIPDIPYFPTEFSGEADGFVRTVPTDPSTGANGVELSLYYDPNDPTLSGLVDFDPATADFVDRTRTQTEEIGDEIFDGFFVFEDMSWKNPEGGTLSNGRDELTFIVYSENADFSSLDGNTDPHWQRFTIVSGNQGNTLPPIQYDPPPTPFTTSLESFVRSTTGDSTTGVNGVTLKLYYDPNDPDLDNLGAFDPSSTQFVDQTSTANRQVGGDIYPGAFTFTELTWEREGGGTLQNGKDTLTVILYSTGVDFSSFEGNTDPTWQRFTLVSGESPNALPDLPHAP